MRILVAEDNRTDRVLLEQILARAGYDVVAAETSEGALEAYRSDGVEVALLDWMLPSTGGLTLTKEIREADMNSGRYCVIVMVTAKARREDVVRAFEAGVDDYISKPIDEVILLAKLKAIVRLSKGMRAVKGGE
jgi:DNA-binding response OmpR family regulator